MTGMATLNIRNVPAEVVATLKERAARKGDSLNAEVVRALTEAAEKRSVDEILENIARINAGRKRGASWDWDDFIDGLRRDRDERGEHIYREATRPPLED
jgi:plasmid stability protein